ncbi:hypothetical protein DJ031_04630 [bacterium endosymbiont of Escarpia laminata]|nr:MAG: hypothetical protein DJ031_04630 [bacterium endosymbiont of Escarpia laminata]
MNYDRMNNSVLRVFGETVSVKSGDLIVEMTAVFGKEAQDVTIGNTVSMRPNETLLAKTTDLAPLCLKHGSKIETREVCYSVVSIDPDDTGMTTLILRKSS